jgi:hypothetical protein
MLFGLFPTSAFSADKGADVSVNAHPNSYGSGWECDQAFRKLRNTCVLS